MMNRKQIIRLTESDLHKIIKESVNTILEDIMIRDPRTGLNRSFKTDKEYKAFVAKFLKQKAAEKEVSKASVGTKPKTKKPAPQKPVSNVVSNVVSNEMSPKAIANSIQKILFDKSLKSIYTFIMHGERSYGPNAMKALYNLYKLELNGRNPFIEFLSKYNEIKRYTGEIINWGSKDEYAVYERCRRLSSTLTDLVHILVDLNITTSNLKANGKLANTLGRDSRVLNGSENGKELGLLNLAFRNAKSISKITDFLNSRADLLYNVGSNGRNPLDYDV